MKYKVIYSGFAYIEADSEEEAIEKFWDGQEVYKEGNKPIVEEVDEFGVLM